MTKEEFQNKLDSKYQDEKLVVKKFKNKSNPITIQTKYGDVYLRTFPTLKEDISSMYGTWQNKAINKTEYFMNRLKDLNLLGYNEIIEVKSEYIKASIKMKFLTKFGMIEITPIALSTGSIPNVRSAINKTQYVKNQLECKYPDLDFSKFEFKTAKSKVIGICKKHGEFKFTVDVALREGTNYLCQSCGEVHQRINRFGIEYMSDSKLYIMEMYNKTEAFYKIGITTNITSRLNSLRKINNYTVELLHLFETGVDSNDYELITLKQLSEYKYHPNFHFDGFKECISINPFETVTNLLKEKSSTTIP